MSRLELYHSKTKQFQWKIPFLFILISILILSGGFLIYQQYGQRLFQANSPDEKQSKKVVVSLPNGQEVFTYEKFIVKKGNRTYYQGERNTIDLTGGKIKYKNW